MFLCGIKMMLMKFGIKFQEWDIYYEIEINI
jgi:hypothetical protein